MTRIRISALKVLVLAGFCALVSLVPSARAAGPFATPECSMPAEGCMTGLSVSNMSYDDKLCDHDPITPPNWESDYGGLDDYNGACPPPDHPDQECKSTKIKDYHEFIELEARIYRLGVCDCYKNNPDPSPALSACLQARLSEYQSHIETLKQTYRSFIDVDCECVVVSQRPTPTIVIPGQVPLKSGDSLKKMLPTSNN